QPDILLCRTESYLSQEIKSKIALFCNVGADDVFTAKDVDCIYEVPLVYNKEGLGDNILKKLNIWARAPRLDEWKEMVEKLKNPRFSVNIAIVGKYVDLTESYKSLNEALTHGGISNDARVNLQYIDSTTLTEDNVVEILSKSDGVLVPGGFGSRGIEGKIVAAKYAREHKVPYFGICLGMHMAVIEIARNLLKLEDAHGQEFDPYTPYPVIYLMKEWYDEQTRQLEKRDEDSDKGGTMRLGAYPCKLVPDTVAMAAYKQEEISERHRHRFEFNNEYKDRLIEEGGLVVSGTSPDHELVEIVELKDHPWYLGCQFHPEFKSKPGNPHPLFREFIKAALKNAKK
ncbi:MAG: CTP synthase, partial [Desulfobacula sp.]|nr:CTP synthase [Desulfobacula sp.]